MLDDVSTGFTTSGNQGKGTMPYMSPEVLDGDGGSGTTASDVYAFGALILEVKSSLISLISATFLTTFRTDIEWEPTLLPNPRQRPGRHATLPRQNSPTPASPHPSPLRSSSRSTLGIVEEMLELETRR